MSSKANGNTEKQIFIDDIFIFIYFHLIYRMLLLEVSRFSMKNDGKLFKHVKIIMYNANKIWFGRSVFKSKYEYGWMDGCRNWRRAAQGLLLKL